MKPISRQTYLDIAGVDLEMFKSLHRRRQVPMLAGGMRRSIDQLEDTDNRGVYLLEDALMLAIADHLVTQNSFTRSTAQRIVTRFPELLVNEVPRSLAGHDIWYAILSWDLGFEKKASPDNAEDKAHWHWTFAGTFDEVVGAIRGEQSTMRSKHGATVDNIAMFNLSAVVNRTKDRAIRLGVVPEFFGATASTPDIPNDRSKKIKRKQERS